MPGTSPFHWERYRVGSVIEWADCMGAQATTAERLPGVRWCEAALKYVSTGPPGFPEPSAPQRKICRYVRGEWPVAFLNTAENRLRLL